AGDHDFITLVLITGPFVEGCEEPPLDVGHALDASLDRRAIDVNVENVEEDRDAGTFGIIEDPDHPAVCRRDDVPGPGRDRPLGIPEEPKTERGQGDAGSGHRGRPPGGKTEPCAGRARRRAEQKEAENERDSLPNDLHPGPGTPASCLWR